MITIQETSALHLNLGLFITLFLCLEVGSSNEVIMQPLVGFECEFGFLES